MLLSINNASEHFNFCLIGEVFNLIFCHICLFFLRMCGQDRTQGSIWEDGCSCNWKGSRPVVEKVQ